MYYFLRHEWHMYTGYNSFCVVTFHHVMRHLLPFTLHGLKPCWHQHCQIFQMASCGCIAINHTGGKIHRAIQSTEITYCIKRMPEELRTLKFVTFSMCFSESHWHSHSALILWLVTVCFHFLHVYFCAPPDKILSLIHI